MNASELKALRQEHGLTQSQMGELIHLTKECST